jgi:hypothetical protein
MSYYSEIHWKRWLVAFIALIFVAVSLTGIDTYREKTKTEIETYTVGCEITQMVYVEESHSKYGTAPNYKMGLRNDDFATTIDITSEQFAMFMIGEMVEVEVTIYEYSDGELKTEYHLIGFH